MADERFVVRIWGARGSYPMPGPSTLRYGGNTTCVEVEVGGHTLIIDAGTGIINLGYDLVRRARANGGQPIVASILLTHMHHDHTQGFPFFAPAYIGSSILHIVGPRTFEQDLEETLNHAVLPPSFPVSLAEMPSLKTVANLRETEMVVMEPGDHTPRIINSYHNSMEFSDDAVRVRAMKSYAHPKSGVYIYRIDYHNCSVVFASDTEGYIDTDRRLVNFARDTDLIIHDSQYTEGDYTASRQGWGHSTPQMACEVARLCNARRLVLFHHEPRYDDESIADMEADAQKLFPATQAAYEGLEIDLTDK
jgi:phosphoribosyl 1,2-cyclic phosphodiesterase